MKPKVNRIVKDLRAELESIYGQRMANLILFGSQARGDAAPGSDVDVLVVLHGDVDPGKEIARTGEEKKGTGWFLAEQGKGVGSLLS